MRVEVRGRTHGNQHEPEASLVVIDFVERNVAVNIAPTSIEIEHYDDNNNVTSQSHYNIETLLELLNAV